MIKISNVSFEYGDRAIFSDFSVELSRRIEVLTGPSGCGKTTLLKLIAGFLHQSSGTVSLDGRSTLLVLQEDPLFPWLTGVENITVMFPNDREIQERVRTHKAYSLVSDFIDRKAWNMSFGQRRSIELFRSFFSYAEILCYDEPFNFLDADRKAKFHHFIAEHAVNRQVVFSTHGLEELSDYGDGYYIFPTTGPVGHLEYRQTSLVNRSLGE